MKAGRILLPMVGALALGAESASKACDVGVDVRIGSRALNYGGCSTSYGFGEQFIFQQRASVVFEPRVVFEPPVLLRQRFDFAPFAVESFGGFGYGCTSRDFGGFSRGGRARSVNFAFEDDGGGRRGRRGRSAVDVNVGGGARERIKLKVRGR